VSKLFYDLFINLYPIVLKIIAPFYPKAKLWRTGRDDIFKKMSRQIKTDKVAVWMHCASLGEFEQGRPVMERLRNEHPEGKILLTFFSPSGYEVRKDYEGADYVFYLPMDSAANARAFLDVAKPQLILFVKYEFWYYYLMEARKRHIPALLVSGIFRRDQPFFKWYGAVHRQMLRSFQHFFVQNDDSQQLLKSLGIFGNMSVSGDTRFDRVIEIAERFKPIASIEAFCGTAQVIVAGSTWTEDDEELDHFANSHPEIRFIIAPHNIGKARLDECLRLYKKSILFSQLGIEPVSANTLIIDNIGMLSRLYKYAAICYVGGGFGADGVHNVLEAAVYGKPVVFGPEYEKFFEAIELVETGGGISVENALELEKEFKNLLTNEKDYNKKAQAAKEYVYSKKGATESIVTYIQENRLLTK
jgi:3-deoxy-D-manno-octulosonic-acid transferase